VNRERILRRVEEIERRANKATPGPWEASPMGFPVAEDGMIVEGAGAEVHPFADVAAKTGVIGERRTGKQVVADAEFIAHAREDVPWLCQVVQELIAQNAAMREALEVIMQTASKLGVYEVAEDALQADAGRDLLDRLRKLEAVAEAAKALLRHGLNDEEVSKQVLTPDSPEGESWRQLLEALAALDGG